MKKLTDEIFKERIFNLEEGRYQTLSPYVKAKNKITIKHLVCGTVYQVTPSDFTSGRRCPKCGAERRKVAKVKGMSLFKSQVESLVGNEYSVDGVYVNWKTKLTFTHNTCGNVFTMEPNSFLQGRRCPPCQHIIEVSKRIKSQEEFEKELEDKFNGEFIALEPYVRSQIKISFKHTICGNIWKSRPANVLQGFGCPFCKQSKGERMISKILDSEGIVYYIQKSFKGLRDKKLLTYDFYIESTKTLIEYQGIQHYEPVDIFGGKVTFEKQLKHDYLKKKYANEQGYQLITIPYTVTNEEEIRKYILS